MTIDGYQIQPSFKNSIKSWYKCGCQNNEDEGLILDHQNDCSLENVKSIYSWKTKENYNSANLLELLDLFTWMDSSHSNVWTFLVKQFLVHQKSLLIKTCLELLHFFKLFMIGVIAKK